MWRAGAATVLVKGRSLSNQVTSTAVFGARGYLGRELMRLLLSHPKIERVTPISSSSVGQAYGDAVPAFLGTDVPFSASDAPEAKADVVFLATNDDDARDALAHVGDATVIDLSRAHRQEALAGDGWRYGWADIDPVAAGTKRIANPGCYPTATAIAMAPALRAGIVTDAPIIVDGKSGVSGAGATPRPDLHFADANESTRAYKVLGHDHGHEIAAATGALGAARKVRFTPHLVPQTRGLLSTVYMTTDSDTEAAQDLYKAAYANAPFVRVVEEPATGNVRYGNRADVAVDVDPDTGILIARCAIDNIVKGGAGTAVQNMNDALGWPSATGLSAVGGGP